MSSLPSSHPRLALHLTDRSHTPIVSSALTACPSQSSSSIQPRQQLLPKPGQFSALDSLTATALSAHDTALRFGLGLPSRIMIEHGTGGPVVLTSYIRPKRKKPAGEEGNGDVEGVTRSMVGVTIGPVPTPPAYPPQFTLPQATAPHQQPAPPPPPLLPHQAQQYQPAGLQIQTQLPSPDPLASYHHQRPLMPQAAPRSPIAYVPPEPEPDDSDPANPMLLSLVVAPSQDEASDARRVAARLERVARNLQAAVAAENEELEAVRASGAEMSAPLGGVVDAGVVAAGTELAAAGAAFIVDESSGTISANGAGSPEETIVAEDD